MTVVTITLSAGDAARVNAAATAAGLPDGKTLAITLVKQAVMQFEQSQLTATYNTPPIAPT